MRCKASPELAAQRLMSPEPVWRTMEDVLHCETYTGSFRRPTEREMLTTTAQEALWLQDTKETMSLNLSPFVGDQSDPLNLSHIWTHPALQGEYLLMAVRGTT